MIKFFRHIRHSLINENRTKKYLLYAVGEIILVVIGILIALQINNWNQNRINRIAEKDIIRKLNKDFKINKKAIEENLLRLENQMDANKILMTLIGASDEELSVHNLDSLFSVSMGDSDIAFADNTLNNLIQTDRLTLIQNEALSDLLYQWGVIKEIRAKRVDRIDNWVNEQYLPYLLSKISFKEMDAYSGFEWAGKSKVKPSYYSLFQEIKFENFLDNVLWYNQKLLERNLETKTLINEIIVQTKSSIND
ncbi:hypothetical protein [Winogradskyella sp.]|uniref:hypothetical protein n=1 Tax=Winogradskyella sp. TaxID=1883156 RepID=UPI001B1E21C8|nr:hypothetical protein [Winogradskyella sp.]MBO6881385.1 hypothetical protein [Winogradskyella sp.]